MHVHIAFFVMQDENTDYPTWDELGRLAPPFSNVFTDRAEAHWTFDLFRDALGRLGVESPVDERVALTMPAHHDGTVLRLNFGRWLVLDIYGPGTDRDSIGMALLDDHLEGAEPRAVSGPFASLSQELPISVHRFARGDVRNWSGNLRAVYEQSFDAIADVFRTWARTPYRGSHRQQVLAAVFDEDLRERLFDRGLAVEAAQPTVSEADIREHPAGGLLLDRSNVILYGPPGTGKTRMARQLMDRWAAWQGAESVRAVTFHPSYAYEDFIEGFRPDEGGQFSRRDGLFVRLCKMAQDAPDQRFLLMIDEINRGDVARLFGELVTLIEPSKRGMRVELPYSQEPFWVPENLYLLGTMNTADRSISLMDIAIRRRFAFKEVAPDASVIKASEAHVSEAGGVDLADLLRGLNARLLSEGIDRDRAIGHSFLLIAAEASDPAAVLRERLRYDIVPLIEEYCYSNRPVVRRILGRLVDDGGRLRGDVLSDPDRLARALRALTPGGEAAPEHG